MTGCSRVAVLQFVLALTILPSPCISTAPTCSGSACQATPSCGDYTNAKFSIKDTQVVCLQYASETTITGSSTPPSQYLYASFNPRVDKYSAFDLSSSGTYTLSTAAKVRVVIGSLRSPWVDLVSSNNQLKMFTVIINMDGGKLKSISLDTCGCSKCISYTSTSDDVCNTNQNQCDSGSVCATECATSGCTAKAKLYVVWEGTDKDDFVLLSSAERFSELNKYSAAGLANDLSDVANSGCQTQSEVGGGCD